MTEPERVRRRLDGCDVKLVDPERVHAVRETMPGPETVDAARRRLRPALGPEPGAPARRCCSRPASCASATSPPRAAARSPSVSHALRLLRANRVVRVRRSGRRAYYSLADSHVRLLLDVALEHIAHETDAGRRRDAAQDPPMSRADHARPTTVMTTTPPRSRGPRPRRPRPRPRRAQPRAVRRRRPSLHLGSRCVLLSVFLVVEVVLGIKAQSLALLTDAGHMLTDIAALVLALVAIALAARPAQRSLHVRLQARRDPVGASRTA